MGFYLNKTMDRDKAKKESFANNENEKCGSIEIPLGVGYISKFGFKQTNPNVKKPEYKMCSVKNLINILPKDRKIKPPNIYSSNNKSTTIKRKPDNNNRTKKVKIINKRNVNSKPKIMQRGTEIDSNLHWNKNYMPLLSQNKMLSKITLSKHQKIKITEIKGKQSNFFKSKNFPRSSQNQTKKKDIVRKKLKESYKPKDNSFKNKNVLKNVSKQNKKLNSVSSLYCFIIKNK